MIQLVLHFLGLAAAVYLIAKVLPGMRLRSFSSALAVSAVYGLINYGVKFLVYKVFFFISYPLLLVTLGLFALVVNAVALIITDKLLDDFELAGFGTALLAAAGISVANIILGALL